MVNEEQPVPGANTQTAPQNQEENQQMNQQETQQEIQQENQQENQQETQQETQQENQQENEQENEQNQEGNRNRFSILHSESPESKQRLLINIYFTEVLPKIRDGERPGEYTEIWCTLFFRSLCWLLLHDSHKNDKQIPKSELMGSRLPVFVI